MIVSTTIRAADPTWIWSGPGVILLKNGNVLDAEDVSPKGKYVSIQLDRTGAIQIPSSEVVTIGRDRLELYQHQVSHTPKWEAGEHFQIAKWCLRNGLVEQAYGHYRQLKAMVGDHRRFHQMESELKQALLRDPTMQDALKAATSSAESPSLGGPAGGGENTLADLAMHQASPSTEPSQSRVGAGTAAGSRSPSSNALPAMTDRMSQLYFQRSIQPFLALRCGQAGCHGAFGKSEFHVAKSGHLKGLPAAEISLASALRFLDSDQFEKTTLWLKSTTRHGTQGTASMSRDNPSDRELLERLRVWHQQQYGVSSSMANRSPPTTISPTNSAILLPPMVVDGARPLAVSPPPASNTASPVTPAGDASSPIPEVGNELLALEREIAKLELIERARKESTPRHDPEEFNRRYANPLR